MFCIGVIYVVRRLETDPREPAIIGSSARLVDNPPYYPRRRGSLAIYKVRLARGEGFSEWLIPRSISLVIVASQKR